jgi:hypothetical protein
LIPDIEKFLPVAVFKMATTIPQKFIIYPHMKWCWNRTILNLCSIVVAILKMATGRNFSMLGINSGHHYLPTYQILDVPNWFLTSNIFYWSPFSKWSPQYRINSTLFNFSVRRIIIIIIITRYDYNLTIMESPKPATDNRFKK